MKTILHAVALCVVCTAALSAAAGSSDFRISVQQESKTSGFATSTLPLLDRTGAKNTETVRDAVLATLKSQNMISADTVQTVESSGTNAAARGDGWLLQVAGKGNWIRYRDMKTLDRGSAKPISMSMMPSAATLEKQGRTAISRYLSDVVKLGTGESIELWYTAFEIRGGQAKDGSRQEAIHNTKVVFTRVVDGIPVLGNGSKIAVLLATDGNMVGFDVDWSPFVKSKVSRNFAGLDLIAERLNGLQTLNIVRDGEFSETIECGYYDVGARQESTGQIQPACLVTQIPTTNTGTPVVVAVPAADEVATDTFWPESVTLQAMAK